MAAAAAPIAAALGGPNVVPCCTVSHYGATCCNTCVATCRICTAPLHTVVRRLALWLRTPPELVRAPACLNLGENPLLVRRQLGPAYLRVMLHSQPHLRGVQRDMRRRTMFVHQATCAYRTT